MSHVVNKAVEVQFKPKSALLIEMLASEIKGRDRRGGCKQKKQVPARVHVMVGGMSEYRWEGNVTPKLTKFYQRNCTLHINCLFSRL